jgi:flagellar motility protein MotE (MotC chaperone)
MKGPMKIIALLAIGIISFVAYLVIFGISAGIKPGQTFSLLTSSKTAGNPELAAKGDSLNLENKTDDASPDSSIGDSTRAVVSADSVQVKDTLANQVEQFTKQTAELKKLKNQMDSLLVAKAKVDSAQVTNLAKIYDGIEASQLAAVLANMDDSLVIAIIPRMKSQKAGKILESMPPDRAARISSKLLGMK